MIIITCLTGVCFDLAFIVVSWWILLVISLSGRCCVMELSRLPSCLFDGPASS